jgi:septum site-determining protein MinC
MPMSAADSLVQIKGLRDSLLVILGDAPWPEREAALLEYIGANPSFFQGARLALDVGSQPLKVAELAHLRDQLSERGISLWAVLSESPLTETTAQNLGLATRLAKPRSPIVSQTITKAPPDTALWLRGPLRSGTHLEHGGNVVVFGDVNPGAEIIAAGSIVVWGRLRGLVHAGAHGDESAVVCALELAPTQLRIAGAIAVPSRKGRKAQPEMARLVDGQIEAEVWKA